MKRKSFSAEFKTKVVLEAISSEKEINQLAKETPLLPILFVTGKSSFLTMLPLFLIPNSMRK
jgi:hypothetical protein